MSGKGSTPRPFSVDRKTFDDNWDRIFKNDYQDILSTEDAVLDAFSKLEDHDNRNKTKKPNNTKSIKNNSK